MCEFPGFVVDYLLENGHGSNDEKGADDYNQSSDTGSIRGKKLYVSLLHPSKAMTDGMNDATNQNIPATIYV